MKRYKLYKSIYILIGSLLIVISGCEEFTETEPYSQVSGDQFWQTESDLRAGLAATYDALQSTLKSNHWHWGEGRSDNFGISEKPSLEIGQLITNTLQTNNETSKWDQLYKVISRANLVIENAPVVGIYDSNILGEAHALRALSYFYGVRIWGDMPLHTEAITSLEQELLKNRTSAEVIINDVILEDLKIANELITNQSGHVTITKGALYALEAHVYMWQGEEALAIDCINKLESLGNYKLAGTENDWAESRDKWIKMFLEESGEELIFSLQWDANSDGVSVGNSNQGVGNAQEILNSGSPDYLYSQTLYEKWIDVFPLDSAIWVSKYPADEYPYWAERRDFGEENLYNYGDWRMFESINILPPVLDPWIPDNKQVTIKYLKQLGEDEGRKEDASDYPIFRYSGILLLKAEAHARLGQKTEATQILNEIRDARVLPRVDQDLGFTELLNAVLDERQFELYAEAHRWYDLRRNKINGSEQVIEVMGPINGFSDPTKFLWPISLTAIERNSKLSQNDGY
ncbi:MAG: RagB/SusD family nutrient uptake outer membrane protein [Reichenbachiella sp.]|uniref:RagB/SusD family nutrient uptake outer membrane protein n=1 Tax=Reichenbachiella sp. TaxID=2184521 RepID=UPI003297F495